jgi:hypothetical protein
MYIVLEMPEARLVHADDEMFVTRCFGDSDDLLAADDLLPAPSYGNCEVELTFDDLWHDDVAEPITYRRI